MKNKKKGILHLFVIFAIIGLCAYTTLVGFNKAHIGSARNIKLGLDLAGGVSITYEVVGDKPTAEQLADTVTMMQKRADVHSTDSQVVTDEKGRIEIDIPGVSDAEEVLADLGKEGSLD
nr:protein translocase subunit SecDF [Lachnospiraceae bacterium]